MKTVSVIIPVYNTEEYVEQCLNSVCNQTYEALEIIVIDDGSTDNSLKIIEEFINKDNRFILYRFDERKGVGAARNLGLSKAKGEFIYFVDSDDYVPNETIKYLVENISNFDLIRGKIKNTYLNSSFTITFKGLFNPKIYDEDKYKLIINNSICNFLFRREFLIENNFKFSEENKVYSDLFFLIPVLEKSKQVPFLKEAVYFRRKRNDPILNPSIRQYDPKLKIESFLNAYIELKDLYVNPLTQQFLDKQFLNFYRKVIVAYFKEEKNIERFFDLLKQAVKKINLNMLKQYDFVLNREIKTIYYGEVKKYTKLLRLLNLLRDIKKGMQSKTRLYIFLYRRVFTKLPMKDDLVFLESFLGKSYSDSPKYIYEYMIKNSLNYKYVWSFREKKNIPGPAKTVKRFSLRYFYYLARAKYWISNSRLPKYLDKREGNIYLQTWHGTPLKMLVFDMKDIYSADPNYKRNFYMQSRRWDYLISANQYSTEIFKRAFLFEKEMLEYGYPRNDILYQKNNKEDILEYKKKLNLPLDKKVILYAPTWRDDEFYGAGRYKFSLKLDLDKMKENFEKDYVILLRMHYFIADSLDLEPYHGFAYDFSNYDDIAELYLVSDILITDYSSVFFDYANLKRPILFFAYDLEKYRDKLRGFYLDIENDVPGPILKTTEEVVSAIRNIDKVKKSYERKYESFYNKFCSWDDGRASERTVKKVFGINGDFDK